MMTNAAGDEPGGLDCTALMTHSGAAVDHGHGSLCYTCVLN